MGPACAFACQEPRKNLSSSRGSKKTSPPRGGPFGERRLITLDHTILRVRDLHKSVDFYTHVVGLSHAGSTGPFEIIRVGTSLTLDLMQEAPKDQVHLAFSLDPDSFEALRTRLVQRGIPFGGDVFTRDGRISENTFGARGIARAFYFYDPDQHNLEARLYTADN
jgi:glyoxylase I family protein